MRKKTLTVDCNTCSLCKVSDEGVFLCHWGKKEPKYMEPAKGKKAVFCRLKRKD
jgi:hypothetical protein